MVSARREASKGQIYFEVNWMVNLNIVFSLDLPSKYTQTLNVLRVIKSIAEGMIGGVNIKVSKS